MPDERSPRVTLAAELHLDDETGTIEPGKLADLVVLDRDPFAGPKSEIGSTGVVATFVQGEPVYLSTSGAAHAAD